MERSDSFSSAHVDILGTTSSYPHVISPPLSNQDNVVVTLPSISSPRPPRFSRACARQCLWKYQYVIGFIVFLMLVAALCVVFIVGAGSDKSKTA